MYLFIRFLDWLVLCHNLTSSHQSVGNKKALASNKEQYIGRLGDGPCAVPRYITTQGSFPAAGKTVVQMPMHTHSTVSGFCIRHSLISSRASTSCNSTNSSKVHIILFPLWVSLARTSPLATMSLWPVAPRPRPQSRCFIVLPFLASLHPPPLSSCPVHHLHTLLQWYIHTCYGSST